MNAVHPTSFARRLRPLALLALVALALHAPAHASPAAPLRVIVALATPAAPASGGPQAPQAVSAAQDALARSLPSYGARELARTTALPLLILEIPPAGLVALAADPRVAGVELDRVARPMLDASAPLVGAPPVWQAGHTGAGQTIVVLDTGVDLAHPFVRDAVVDGACFSTSVSYPPGDPDNPNNINYTSVSLCPDGNQAQFGRAAGAACPLAVFGCDHGTHVAGIAAGRADGVPMAGVARGASVVSVQVYSRFSGRACGMVQTQGYCALSWSSDQLRALDWVYATLRTRADVAAVNLSLGDVVPLAAPCDAQLPATQLAIQRLRDAGIPTVAAAGNGYSADPDAPKLSSPACLSGAIAVGATDLDDNVASFSNSAPQLALLAPGAGRGGGIRSSLPGGVYGARQGTSMAVPHVAGAWAVLRAARPEATFAQILAALTSTGAPVTDVRNGLTRPRIRLDAALEALSRPSAALDISTRSLSFGEHTVGAVSPPQAVMLSNPGGVLLQISAVGVSGDFVRVGGSCPAGDAGLEPGASCTVEVAFAPAQPGERSGAITVTSPGAALGAITLSGVGRLPLAPRVLLPLVAG